MTKRAAVMGDLSGFGRCSLTAAIAVLSAMGVAPCPLPTAVLSAQSEFSCYASRDLSDALPAFAAAWRQNGERFDAVCTGYFADARQIDFALDFCDDFHTDGCLLLVDPVMGDGGALYPAYGEDAVAAMKRLAARADVLTPNLTELCLLTGEDYASLTAHSGDADYVQRIRRLADGLKAKATVVTGIETGGAVCCLSLKAGKEHLLRTPLRGGRFSGTGDLFAAAVCGGLLNGLPLPDAVATAADFIVKSIDDTLREPHDPLYGVCFEKNLSMLTEVSKHANT